MGCFGSTNKSYFEIDNAEEKGIRKFEKENGSFTVDFSFILQKLSFATDTLKQGYVKHISEKFFSPKFYNIIESNNYFKIDDNGKTYLDCKKVVALFFLLTCSSVVSNKTSAYNDKAYYLYLKGKGKQEDDLDEGLTKDESLLNFIKLLIEVSCYGFLSSYYQIQGIEKRGLILEIQNQIDKLADIVIDSLFTVSNNKVDVLSFKELRSKFDNDSYFFSSGYFREKATALLNTKKN